MKKILALLLALGALLPASFALAHDVPTGGIGSITMLLEHDGAPLTTGTYHLNRVGDVLESNGDYSFIFTAEYAHIPMDSAKFSDPDYIRQLLDVGTAAVAVKQANADGAVYFPNLSEGLYLIHRETTPEDPAAVAPLLVSIPMLSEGKYIYDVQANSKVEISTVMPPTAPAPTNPPPGLILPQTGQLWWPVPVLAAAGVFCVIMGMLQRRGNGDE